MNNYLSHYKFNFDYNFTGDLSLPCVCCGKSNIKYARVDTEDLFNVEESWCLKCWLQHVLDTPHLCRQRIELDQLIQTTI